jgi:hypothetical protein
VSKVAPGTTIHVCPGTYAEQVTITKPLTLEGVTAGTANQALITVPSGGLVANAVSMFGESVAAQVLIQGAGPVNITNITVDGTGGDLGCMSTTWSAGIFYGSSSSGTVNRMRASNQINGSCGVGIWAENADSSFQSVTIENSTVYNVDAEGIFVGSGATPTLSVNVHGNVVNASAGLAGILAESVNGQIHDNDMSNGVVGVFDAAPVVGIGSNTIVASAYGMFLLSGGTATNNNIFGSNIGVFLGAPGATLHGNRIVSSAGAAVELSCFEASVSGNFINDAAVGLDQVRLGVIGPNTLVNTATTITDGCVAVAAAARAMQANVQEQWHTPATPFGTRMK